MKTRNTTVDGQNFNLTDVEILELARKAAQIEHVDALKMFLDTHYDGDRELDFDLDEWRRANSVSSQRRSSGVRRK